MASSRNPTWERDEVILALDQYMTHRRNVRATTSRVIIQPEATAELSNLLSQRASVLSIVGGDESFRNEASVNMKLMNFLAIDPEYAGKGLGHRGRRDKEIWDEFADDRRGLQAAANAIRRSIELSRRQDLLDEVDGDDEEFSEGRVARRLHTSRERSQTAARKKKRLALKRLGRLSCEVCEFDFRQAYGNLGDGFIECHHLIPVSEWPDKGKRTKLSELALVCPNCHRMLHRRRPWQSIAGLKATLAANASG